MMMLLGVVALRASEDSLRRREHGNHQLEEGERLLKREYRRGFSL
jgi:hypothetical protein